MNEKNIGAKVWQVSGKWLICAIVLLAVLLPEHVVATHIVGGDMTYRCLGNNQYEIRLTLRRDCLLAGPNTEFDDPASIGIFRLSDMSMFLHLQTPYRVDDTLNQIFISDCTIAGQDVCVHQTTYVDTVTLPFLAAGYMLAYQRCCRNATVQNIVSPLQTGMTVTATITAAAQQQCLDSPKFGDYPPIYICVESPIDFDFSVTNGGADSLVYELYTPNAGATHLSPKPQPPPNPPYELVEWADPYGLENLLGGPDPLTIDQETGFLTGTPPLIGQFLAGVRIRAYRNGQLYSVTTREWQYNIRACRDVPIARFTPSTELSCESLTISFTDDSHMADEYLWHFNWGDPMSPTSAEQNPEFTFPSGGFYDVALIVNDADSICFDTTIVRIGAFVSELNAQFAIDVPECENFILVSAQDQSTEPDTFDIVAWLWTWVSGNDTVMTGLQHPQFLFTQSTQDVHVMLVVTSGNGCTATADTTFDVNIIRADFKGDTIGVCDGDSVLLFNGVGGPFEYTWSPTETLDLTDPANPSAFPTETTTYYVTVTDGLCTIMDSVVVAVQELPDLSFAAFTDCRSLSIDFFNTSIGGFQFQWDFGDGEGTSLEASPSYTYEAPGEYTVTLISADGCDVAFDSVITVSIITAMVGDTAISCFLEPVVLNAGGSDAYSYEWSPAELLDDPMAISPVAEVIETTTFYVTITDHELPGCHVLDSVTVVAPPDFVLAAPSDTAYCDGPEITLIGGNPALIYQWYSEDGELLAEGPTFVTAPQEETTYIVTGTDAFGCSKSDTVTLSPTFFDIEAGPGHVLCPGDTVGIFVINHDPSQNLSYSWEPSEFIIGPNDVTNPTVSPPFDQTFMVFIVNEDLGCIHTEEIRVAVSNFNYNISPDALICLGESITLNVINNDTTTLSYSWTPVESIISGANSASPTVMPTETTTYHVHIFNTDYGCETDTSVTVMVSWFDPVVLEIIIEIDSAILNTDEVIILSTNQDPSHQFQWSGHGIVDPTLPVITVVPTIAGMHVYSVTVTNADGCAITGQSAAATVLDPECDDSTIFVPTAFSPNGDGQNDVFMVEGNFIIELELRIYNRWGEEVFVSFDQNNPWDGTYKGKQLGMDVFGYYLRVRCPPDKTFFKKGNVTLFR